MTFSEDQPKKTTKAKPREIESRIVIIKIGEGIHIKVLQYGDKAVVRQGAQILFNNLKNKLDFNKWWEETLDSIGKKTKIDVVKSEVVDNKAMKDIHSKYGG